MTEIKKTRVDSDMTLVWLKKLADIVVNVLLKTPVTPNQVTLANFLIFAPLASYLLFVGDYVHNLLALFVLIISSFIDLVDGELARQSKRVSKLGAWYESSLDPLTQSMVIFSIALHILFYIPADWKYLALLPLFSQGFANYLGITFSNLFKIDPLTGNPELNESANRSHSGIDFLLRNIIVPTHWLFILLFTLRFHMIIGILLNVLPFTFLVFGVFITIRVMVMYLVLCLHYKDDTRLNKYEIFRYLKRSTHE